MAMKILGKEKPEDIFVKASDMLANAVRHTLGPKGLNTAVCTSSSGHYQILNDGKVIVQDLTSDDPALSPAIELLKQSCFETNRKAGDGTTSTILMTNSLLKNTYKYMNSKKINKIEMRDMLLSVRDSLLLYVDTNKRDINEEQYEDVAKVALGGSDYAKLISDAYKFVGKDGVVTFLKEDQKEVTLEKNDGITLDKSELKIIPMKDTREFHDIKAVFLYERVDRFAEIIDLLNKTVEYKGKKVLFFYNELSWDASSNIYANIGNGNIDIIPIRLGAYGVNTREVMEQLSDYCGCKLIDGISVNLASLKELDEVFGSIKYSLISENKIVVKSNKKSVENSKNTFKLSNKSCIIRVGGNNKVEQEETYRRIEDAVSSLGTAIKDGITIGGGLTYLNAFESIRVLKEYDFLKEVGEVIYRTIVYNTTGITNIAKDNIGLFPGDYEWIDLDNTIFDSSMVVKEVINNSFSLVAQIITTEKLVHEMIR